MIDLHTHTYYSDGTLSPEALMKLAAEEGIQTLAITDHDGVDGLEMGFAAASKYGVRLISGVELSAQLPESGEGAQLPLYSYMHILGYGFDPHNKLLQEKLEVIREKRRQRNIQLQGALEKLGFVVCPEDIQVYPGQDYIGKPNFARALVKHGYAPDVAAAFASEQMLAAPSVKAIHREKIDVAEAIELIRWAGGFAVLAHPMKVTYKGKTQETPKAFLTRLESIVKKLTALGLSGMECCYSAHTCQETEELLAMAKEFGLFVTGGSDFHGPGMKKGIRLGGFQGQDRLSENMFKETVNEL